MNKPDEIRTMSMDSILRAKRHEFKSCMETAIEALRDEPGQLVSRDADYEVAWYEEPDCRVVIYPHRTSADNYHLRTRAQGRNQRRAKQIMAKLYLATGYNCTFQWKGMRFGELDEFTEGTQ